MTLTPPRYFKVFLNFYSTLPAGSVTSGISGTTIIVVAIVGLVLLVILVLIVVVVVIYRMCRKRGKFKM